MSITSVYELNFKVWLHTFLTFYITYNFPFLPANDIWLGLQHNNLFISHTDILLSKTILSNYIHTANSMEMFSLTESLFSSGNQYNIPVTFHEVLATVVYDLRSYEFVVIRNLNNVAGCILYFHVSTSW